MESGHVGPGIYQQGRHGKGQGRHECKSSHRLFCFSHGLSGIAKKFAYQHGRNALQQLTKMAKYKLCKARSVFKKAFGEVARITRGVFAGGVGGCAQVPPTTHQPPAAGSLHNHIFKRELHVPSWRRRPSSSAWSPAMMSGRMEPGLESILPRQQNCQWRRRPRQQRYEQQTPLLRGSSMTLSLACVR